MKDTGKHDVVEAGGDGAGAEEREGSGEGLPPPRPQKHAVVGLVVSCLAEAVVIPINLGFIAMMFEHSGFVDSIDDELHVGEVELIEDALELVEDIGNLAVLPKFCFALLDFDWTDLRELLYLPDHVGGDARVEGSQVVVDLLFEAGAELAVGLLWGLSRADQLHQQEVGRNGADHGGHSYSM